MSSSEAPPMSSEPRTFSPEEQDLARGMYLEALAIKREMGYDVLSPEGRNALASIAKGVDPLYQEQQEDKNRVHDVEEAHAAALREEADRVYEEATLENERHDAHIAEQKAAAELEEKRKADAELIARESAKQGRIQEAQAKVAESQGTNASEAIERDLHKTAEALLKEAGHNEPIPMSSHVAEDAAGNLLVIHGMNVKVLETQPGGKASVTEYNFDQATGVLTINRPDGHTVMASASEYAPTEQGQVQLGTQAIDLPPSIAHIVGFDRAIPL